MRNSGSLLVLVAAASVAFGLTARVEAAPPPMLLPGQMDVSPSGAFTYTVPITVAPGTAGMVPSLSLEYSSQSGDGIMGLGWSLTGLPSIGRCPRTVAQDAIKGSVNYDANDRFCMEGQRLVAISGTYGANNTEYRTEIEGFTKVVSYGTAGTGPAWFKVWTKSGQIMEFGNTTDSRILAQGITTARSWAVNKITDTKGNYLTVTYTNDTTNGQAYPTRIDYAGNAGAALTPYNSVRFTYNTNRPDQVPLYHAGSLQKTTVLLTNVKTYEGNNVVRDYQITYELGTAFRRSRITEIKVCDNTANCLAPTTFGWQGTRDTITVSGPQPAGVNTVADLAEISAGMGADGNTAWVETGWWTGNCSGRGLLGDWVGKGSVDIAVQKLRIPSGDPEEFDVWFCVGGVKKQKFSLHTLDQFQFMELNGDGRTDFIKDGTAYLSNGTGYFTASGSYVGSYFDADGDGCTDRLWGTTLYFSTFCPAAIPSFTFPTFSGYETALGDFNGDGIPDVLVVHNTAAGYVRLGTGRNIATQTYPVPATWAKYSIYPGDFNGDGRTDVALVAATTSGGNYGYPNPHLIYLSTGTGFTNPSAAFITNINSENNALGVFVADWNNDGAADLWMQDYSSGDQKYLITYVPEFVNSVSNGLGITTTVTYDKLNNPAVYTKDTTGTYPEVNINGPYYVVSRIDSGNGIGGTYSSTYRYVGLKADHAGRGFKGFRQRIITDLQTNVIETTTFRQDYPYIGLVESQTKVLGAATLNAKTNTFTATNLGGTRYFVGLSQTVEASSDLDGTTMPTITASYQYDAFGNPIQVSITTPDGSSKVTSSTYSNDTNNWILGRLLIADQTNTVAGNSVTRQTSYAYDIASGLLTQEVIEPNLTPLRLQTDYAHDAFGNRISTTVSGVDIVTRTSTIAYDARGRFAVSVTNPLNQAISQEHDPRHGLVTSSTDANGLITTSSYDAFGRVIHDIGPDAQKVESVYEYCAGVNGGAATCPDGAFVVSATPYAADGTTQNGPQIRVFFDKLAREITQDMQGFDGSWTRSVTIYDSYGRVAQVSRPYFVNGGTPKWIVQTYDDIGRVVDIVEPNGGHTATAYNGLTSAVTNPLNQTTTTVKNQRGMVESVTDNAGTTTYTYDQFDNVKTITDSTGNVTTFTYDTRGRKIASNDPDMGLWQYEYNTLGEVVSQTDAKNQTTTLTFDTLGRIAQRVEVGQTSTWTYDTATNGIGKLAADSASNGANHTYVYDSLGRVVTTTTTVDGNPYSVTTTYDADGRPDVITYPSGFAVRHEYTNLGYLYRLLNNVTSNALWTANTANAELQITEETAGNGVVTNRTYDPNTGLVQTVQAGMSNAVANFSYTFNAVATLTARTDAINSVTESFTYDNMNRLTNYDIVGGSSKTVGYDALGNITSKSDVGAYSYPTSGSARPHAVGSITGTINTIFTYDANGNMIAGQGRTVTYTSFNMAASITQGSSTVMLDYDADHKRIKQTAPDGTTIYVAGPVGVERLTASSGLVTWNEYLSAGGQLVGVHFSRSDATQNTRHFVTDHLGSVAVLTDEMGTVVERLAYDAWGKRRYPNGADDPTGSITSQTTKGFTGHEHIAPVGLINMNARVYDPVIGRFMTPDSAIEDLYLSQILNRYTYVGNNPLSFTDPTGHSWLSKLFRHVPILRTIFAIAVAVIFQRYEVLAYIGITNAYASVAIIGGIAGAIAGGTLKGALLGALQGVAFNLVGGINIAPEGSVGAFLASAGLHGLVGGLISVLQGENFASGFLAGGFARLAGPINARSVGGNAIIRALVGGVASVIGGGKFATGAITGAFGYLFNEAAANHAPCGNGGRCFTPEEIRYQAFRKLPYDPNGPEYGIVIYQDAEGYYRMSAPIRGGTSVGQAGAVNFCLAVAAQFRCGDNVTSTVTRPGRFGILSDRPYPVVELVHSHPHQMYNITPYLAGPDTEIAEKWGVNVSVRYNDTYRIYDWRAMSWNRIGLNQFAAHPGRVLKCTPLDFRSSEGTCR